MTTSNPTDPDAALVEEITRLKHLIVHMQIHSGYPQNGRQQMTTEQKALYDEIDASSEAIIDRAWGDIVRARAAIAAMREDLSRALAESEQRSREMREAMRVSPLKAMERIGAAQPEPTDADAVEVVAKVIEDNGREIEDGFTLEVAAKILGALRAIGRGPK